MRIVYLGTKEVKADNVAQTGLVWTRGEIHEVPDEKAAKLLEHPLIWGDADKPYELIQEMKAIPPEPRVNFIPKNNSPYWDPIVVVVTEDVYRKLQDQSLLPVFMSGEDADAFADWKQIDTTPANTGPIDKRTKAYRDSKKAS